MARKRKEDDLNIFAELAAGLEKQVTSPNILAYEPHAKQELFHKSPKYGRLYIGGNRSGKTVGGVTEDLMWIRHQHPYRKIPEGQIRGRVHSPSILDGINTIMLPQFSQWTPPSMLINGSWEDSYNKQERTLNFAGREKSFIEFMSYEQDIEKFAGTSRHFCHYDEEPPKGIFNESNARLIDTEGSWWITMTPVEGMTWIFDEIYEPATLTEHSDIDVIVVDMTENPHLSGEAIRRFLIGLDEDERKARKSGTFVQLGGRVYKHFSRNVHVVEPFIPPRDWQWYASMDHGFNAPTAWLWHAVSPDNFVVTFAEHFKNEMTVEQHAAVVHARNSAFERVPDYYVGDPAIGQRQGVTGTSIHMEYARHGIPIALGNNDVAFGVSRVSQYLRTDPLARKPHWVITANCENLIREMERLRWKTYASKKLQYENNPQDKIHKKDDHAADAARYFFTFLPELHIPEEAPALVTPKSTAGKIERYDDVLAKMVDRQEATDWSIYESDDHMVDY